MKRYITRIAVLAVTFTLGFFTSYKASSNPASLERYDAREYPVTMTDLAARSDFYDGKTVRVKADFNVLSGTSLGNLDLRDSGHFWVRAICVADQTECNELFTSTRLPFDQIPESTKFVEVVGRYHVNVDDPHPSVIHEKVRLLEISKVVAVYPYRPGKGSGTGTGK
jgi:hypothetical protein